MLHKRLLMIVGILLAVVLSADGAKKMFTLVIDAGHGGKDTGACGKQSAEKTLTLRYALAFGRIVEENCPDVRVVYTRKNDRFLELWQRAEVANSYKADLFVSVHINAMPKGRICRGYQTYTLGRSRRDGNTHGFEENLEVAKRENAVILYEDNYQQHYEGFDPNSPESNILFELVQDKNMEKSIQLAKLMQKNICQATGRLDKGVHQDNLAVLRLTSMPACLMELGYISTPDEEQFLNSERAVRQYTRGFFNAFVAYKNKVQPGIKVPYKPLTEIKDEPAGESGATGASGANGANGASGASGANGTAGANGTSGTNGTAGESGASGAAENAPSERQKAEAGTAPVFKVQILVSDKKLKATDRQLKGLKDATYYKEGRMYKYTVGASEDYQEIYRLRKSILNKFPEAFIIAFEGDQKVDANAARRKRR